MSDIKHPAPFYTLKEAAKELNRILKVDYYDSKKLLSISLVYDLKLYAYFYGAYNVSIDAIFPVKRTKEPDKYEKLIKLTEEIVESEIYHGTLLEIDEYVIQNIYFFGQSNVSDFGFRNITNLKEDELNNSHFVNCTGSRGKYLEYVSEKGLQEIEILAIYPMLEQIGEKHTMMPAKYNTVEYTEGEYTYHPIIRKKDIYVPHSQLVRVLDGKLSSRNNDRNDQEHEAKRTAIRKPRGKSKAKEFAQRAAQEIARHLWIQDKEKQIKTGAMCELIWNTLCETEHLEQLPNKAEALKDWIKNIAPEYAREAGRPKKIQSK